LVPLKKYTHDPICNIDSLPYAGYDKQLCHHIISHFMTSSQQQSNSIFQRSSYDVIIIGAGAAGLMAAATAAKRNRSVLILEHTQKIGEKIRISGGGRCNFTNIHASSQNYLSQNPHFVKSALAQYTPQDFIKQVENYGIQYYEKTLGQLFCEGSSKQIIHMLQNMGKQHGVEICTGCSVYQINKTEHFGLTTNYGYLTCKSVIIASGGLSIPKIGASNFAYRTAEYFDVQVIEPRPALVPLVLDEQDIRYTELRGISFYGEVSHQNISFQEGILFTHKGLSGPAILQISSYLKSEQHSKIKINMLPHLNIEKHILANKKNRQFLGNFLKEYLAERMIRYLVSEDLATKRLSDLSKKEILQLSEKIHTLNIDISGNEGYKKAEVTAGGVHTQELSSKTMESKKIPGLYWIGEAVDVTGWLGGYNFQWAWSSGFAAGSHA
jgi:predicted Rossmann fold flavoprotein